MNDCDQKEHLSFALLPVFTIGAKDGINPCGIAAVLIFIIYLSRVGRTQRRLAGFGALFIASAVMTHFVLLFGAGDPLLASPVVYGAIRAAYLFLAAVFLVLGVLHISDWRRYRKCFDGGCFNLALPVFLRGDVMDRSAGRARKILSGVSAAFLAVFAGATMTFMGSIYPEDEYVFALLSFLLAGGDRGFTLQSFFLYSTAAVLPLIFAWLAILCIARKGTKSPKVVLYYKGILSALFLAAAVGVGYLFLGIIT